MEMNKKSRQGALLELIDRTSVYSQTELAVKLGEKGFAVTQASVSRDLDELGVVKKNGRYVRPSVNGTESDFGAITFDVAGENLIVGRCVSGLASAITVRIDRTRIREVVGTIAGDDTIFIAVKNVTDQNTVLDKLGEMFG